MTQILCKSLHSKFSCTNKNHWGGSYRAINLFYATEAKSRDAFVPPKPKEFDKATRIGTCLCEVNGMKFSSNMGSGSLRLREGGATPYNETAQ